MPMNRRDFLGGVVALLPVVACAPIPTDLRRIDPTKPIVIEKPQIITPDQIDPKGIPVLTNGKPALLRIEQDGTVTVVHFVVTSVELRHHVFDHPMMNRKGQMMVIPDVHQMEINISGLSESSSRTWIEPS